jgi:hypothetical protein
MVRSTARSYHPDGIVSACSRGSCRLTLDCASVCIDCDITALFSDQDRRPDFLIAAIDQANSHLSWIVAEMKTGDVEPAEVQKQLQAGANALINSQIYTPNQCKFVPLVVRDRRRGRVHVAERHMLDRLKVAFGPTKRTILIEPCGSHVSRILR